MMAAKRSPSSSSVNTAAEKLFRGLLYYTALFVCVAVALVVSFAVMLHVARDSVRDQTADPAAVNEARSLRDYARELKDIHGTLAVYAKDGETPPESFHRRLNDLRRRMRQFPHESAALSALIQTGDGLLAWASGPDDAAARARATEALDEAETAVRDRIGVLNVPNSSL